MNKITFPKDITDNEIIHREATDEEKKVARLIEIDQELNELNKDFIQELCGAIIPNIEEKKARFRELHNEKRVLQGKEPRKYN